MFTKRAVEARKRKKEQLKHLKKGRVSCLQIWINGVEIELERKCEFCETRIAVVHCPACDHNQDGHGDFLCDDCDQEVHRHEKRKDHIRTLVPFGMNADLASNKIVGMFRYAIARTELLRRCRSRFRRYYDSKSRLYFYYNTQSHESSWSKPWCLHDDSDLMPFPSFEQCAFRIQNCWRGKKARLHMIHTIQNVYEKLYSREHRCFYYFYNGNSKLVPQVTWTKPFFLFHHDLRPSKNPDLAALLIQRQWLAYRSRTFLLNIVRTRYQANKDPLSGRHVYTHIATGKRSIKKPPLLGVNDEFDPDDISLWDVRKVNIWLRRLGLKYVAADALKFKIDGPLLLSFEWDDFFALGIRLNHQVKRILLDIEQRAFFAKHRDLPITILRRDRLRYHFRVEKACLIIQRKLRERYGRILRAQIRETARLVQERERLKKLREDGLLWWARKLKTKHAPPDYGKTFGQDQLIYGVHGRGHYDQATTWQPTKIPLPAPVSFQPMKPNNIMLQHRGLHFARQAPADEARLLFFKKFSSDSLTAQAAKERGEPPPTLASISGTRSLPSLSVMAPAVTRLSSC